MAGLAYTVLTEFRFDVQKAIAGSEMLQGAVAKVSDTADSLISKLSLIPRMLMSNFGVSFSLAGIFGGAISSAEKLQETMLAFSNIMSANREHLTGPIDSFNDRMAMSKQIIDDLALSAQKFSLDEGAFISMTKLMAAQLVPKGLAGENFGTAKEMSRGLLKSAPILGVDPNFVQGELLRSLEGSASMNDTLFRRLAAETRVFQDLKKGIVPGLDGGAPGKAPAIKGGKATGESVSKLFNSLPSATRVLVLTKALTQFGDDADVVAGNAALLSNRLMSIRYQFLGVRSVLIPLGAVIIPRLRMALDYVANIIEKRIRPGIQHIARLFDGALGDPKRIIATLQQLRRLKHDLDIAGRVASLSGSLHTIMFFYGLIQAFPNAFLRLGNAIHRGMIAIGMGGTATFLSTKFAAVSGVLKKAGTSMQTFVNTTSRTAASAGMAAAAGVATKGLNATSAAFATFGTKLGKVGAAGGLGALAANTGKHLHFVGTAIKTFVNRAILYTLGGTLVTGLAVAGGSLYLFFSNLGRILTTFGKISMLVFRSYLLPLAITTGIMQLISRARAYGKIKAVEELYDPEKGLALKSAQLAMATGELIKPFDDFIDQLARAIHPMFAITTYAGPLSTALDVMIVTMQLARDATIALAGEIQSFIWAVAQAGTDATSGNFWQMTGDLISVVFKNIWKNIVDFASEGAALVLNVFKLLFAGIEGLVMGVNAYLPNFITGMKHGEEKTFMGEFSKAFENINWLKGNGGPTNVLSGLGETEGWKETHKSMLAGYGDIADLYKDVYGTDAREKLKVVNAGTTINGGVTIKNEFREQMEPDRIANSLVNTLMAVAENPRQAKNGSLKGGFFR